MKFTEEEMAILATMEDKLYTACYCKFVRLSNRSQLEQLDVIYKKAFNTTQGAIGACNHCLMEICKKVGKLYFDQKKEMENEAKNKAVEQPEEEKATDTPKTTKTVKKTTKKTNKKK